MKFSIDFLLTFTYISRATVFLRLSAAVIIGEMFASPLSAILMNFNPWLPVFIGLGSLALATCMSLILPETLGRSVLEPVEHAAAPRHLNHENVRGVGPLPNDKSWRIWWHWSKSQVLHIHVNSQLMWKNKTVFLLLFTFLVTTLGRFVQELLMQYTTKKFHWTWSQVSPICHISFTI
jgi:hypothetical protein